MGIFKDFATSGYGDFTVGALSGLAEQGRLDYEKNVMFAQDSLNKESAAFAETELAFKNKKEITNIIANNPLAFGITATADLNANQIADRLTNKIFNEQRSIFENTDMNKVKMGVAKYLTRPGNLGEGVELTSPYIPSEDLFQAEKDKHAAKLSEISKTPKVDKLLMNIQEAEESIATPEAITDSLTKVASITAKGYGILNTFPGTPEGDTNLKFMQTNIIVANAKAQFPNNATERANFIDKKLYDNNIDPMAAVSFQNPVTFKAMSKVLDAQGNALASKIAELTNAMAQAGPDEERVQIQNQINQVIMQQYALINTYSQSVPTALAGRDRDLKQPVTPTETIETPAVEDEQTPGLFKRETKPAKPLKEILPDIRGGEPEDVDDTGMSAYQARFKFNAVDQLYLVEQWRKNYQSKNKIYDGLKNNVKLLLGTNDMPQEAADQVNQVANAFDGDGGFNRDQIAEMLNAIGFIESKYETKVQRGGGPARSYWQVEPETASDMLKQNLSAMKTGRNPLMGQNFENLFKSKYSEAIGNRTALEYFASLNEKQLQQLLLEDGLFAAAMAAHKVVSTFDPYGSREA
jgi:hypothetical protein